MELENNSLSDIWESLPSVFEIEEDNISEVDGIHILARVVGPAFFPNTTSKNRVHYPIEAWENAISDPRFLSRLNSRLVFGTIGHNIELTDDAIREGKFSHIVTKTWIDDDNIGKAEYLILNTPPGRTLNTLLRAKCKLRVSTKAGGLYESTSSGGVRTVKPDSFMLERIDFVIDPGYIEALPQLIESLHENSSSLSLDKGKLMNTENNNKPVEILESLLVNMQGKATLTEEQLKNLNESLTNIKVEQARTSAILENYQAIGTVTAIHEQFAELEQYRLIGSVQEIHEAFDKGEETVRDLTATVDTIGTQIADLKKPVDEDDSDYTELGSPQEVKDALSQALEIADELQAYRDLGSVDELKEVITNAEAMTSTLESKEKESICAKYSVDCGILDSLLSKGMTLEEVDDMLAKIKTPDQSSTTAAIPPVEGNGTTEETPPVVVPPEDTSGSGSGSGENEEEEDDVNLNESLSSRLIRNLSSKNKVSINESNKILKDNAKNALLNSSRAAKLISRIGR